MTDKRFIDQFDENVRKYPNKILLQQEDDSITFKELDILSGRVYNYLNQAGIGTEDRVLINLPHSIAAHVAIMGVWKNGAACVLGNSEFSDERTAYILSDCNCKLVIDNSLWKEITSLPSREGHNETNQHDAAYIIYTSGSEGVPKGVVHEYGKLEFMPAYLSKVCRIVLPAETIMYSYLPINTVGTIANLTMGIWNPMTVDIGSISLMKNPARLTEYFEARRITLAFMPPSYYAKVRIKTSHLKCVYFASEKTSAIYSDDCTHVNLFIQSEGYHLLGFVLDKEYANTPVGTPVEDSFACIQDDEGNMTRQSGAVGELCYQNPYFREYVNQPQLTRESFHDGYFSSGDIARINEDGNYVILGRKTDMIKINGNRIEPAEIEAAVKRVLGIDWAFAKGFVQPDRSFICVYYTAPISIDYATVREELLRILPTYMIPSYFIHIDDIPHLPNGKVNRQAFKAPDVADYVAPYAAPTNALEERLCTVMAQVLDLPRIGIHDDFYLLGGDSLRTISLISQLDIQDLNVSDVYAARTPASLAERWLLKQL